MKDKATWHYRVIRHVDGAAEWFGIHEVYVSKDGNLSWTSDPIKLTGDSVKDLEIDLDKMLKDIRTRNVMVINKDNIVVDLEQGPSKL